MSWAIAATLPRCLYKSKVVDVCKLLFTQKMINSEYKDEVNIPPPIKVLINTAQFPPIPAKVDQ